MSLFVTRTKSCPCIIINHLNNLPNCPIISTLRPNLLAMDETAKTENKIRKGLLVITILFALFFAGMLTYYITVHERWQLWVPIAALMVISAAHAVRLYRFIKRDS